jgi:hypothetical protein
MVPESMVFLQAYIPPIDHSDPVHAGIKRN